MIQPQAAWKYPEPLPVRDEFDSIILLLPDYAKA